MVPIPTCWIRARKRFVWNPIQHLQPTRESIPIYLKLVWLLMFVEYEDRIYAAKTKYVPSMLKLMVWSKEQEPCLTKRHGGHSLLYRSARSENYYVFDFDFKFPDFWGDTYYTNWLSVFLFLWGEAWTRRWNYSKYSCADEKFYRYMNLLLEQTKADLVSLKPQPQQCIGNIFDVTGIDKPQSVWQCRNSG